MANSKSGKGNPAAHRMQNKALKERRERCWRRGEERKALRRKENERRAAANVERRKNGEMTPWEISQAARKERRNALQNDALQPESKPVPEMIPV